MKVILKKLSHSKILILLLLFLTNLASAQTALWLPLVKESKVVMHVKVKVISEPSLFSSDFQIERTLDCEVLDVLYESSGTKTDSSKSIKVTYKTGADNAFYNKDNLAIREGRDYFVFLRDFSEVKEIGKVYSLINNALGIIQFDPLCKGEILQAIKGIKK